MPQRKGARPKRAPADLDRLEWWFGDCAADELYDCWRYEFARELPWVRQLVAKQRAKQKAKQLEEFAQATGYSFLLFPRWPAQPYLSVEAQERVRYLRSMRPTLKEAESQAFWPSWQNGFPKQLASLFQKALEQTGRPVIKSPSGRLELALFYIDWGIPDRFLLQFFKSYLELNRPPEIRPVQYRAKNMPDTKRKQQLRDLGMYRLLRANSFNHLATHKAFGDRFGPLKKVDAWYRARSNTKSVITEVGVEMSSFFFRTFGTDWS